MDKVLITSYSSNKLNNIWYLNFYISKYINNNIKVIFGLITITLLKPKAKLFGIKK